MSDEQGTEETAIEAQQPTQKQMRLDGFEGHTIDTIRIPFSGAVELNRHDPDAVKFFKQLRLGKRIDLAISGQVAARSFKLKHHEDGTDTITEATIKVDTISDVE